MTLIMNIHVEMESAQTICNNIIYLVVLKMNWSKRHCSHSSLDSEIDFFFNYVFRSQLSKNINIFLSSVLRGTKRPSSSGHKA